MFSGVDSIPWSMVGYSLAGGLLTALALRRINERTTPTPPPAPAPPASIAAPSARWPEPTLPVLDFAALVDVTHIADYLEQTRRSCGLNAGTWDGFIVPIIQNVAELMQQLPASESHHHAQPGGLLIHTCETLRHAVRLRQGMVLPAGRDAEDQARHKHRWTAGVIVAALLHDVGKPVTDLVVRLYGGDHRGTPWNAIAGDMRTAKATHYAVDFPAVADRDYKAHQRHGALLMQRLVPSATLTWIGEDPSLLTTLMQYLAGDVAEDPIATLVSAAEQESVRANLLDGARTRFSTARATPLIERLMDALRRMLAEGGHLPLNRPGAAGYVFEGDVWFAAARLANAVRDYLRANESSIGIPGEDKNDRLFDAWQDYGACRSNPATGRALFSGRVVFDSGSDGYDLPSMLRFPLDKLYPAESYPVCLAGRIDVLEKTAKDEVPKASGAVSTPAIAIPAAAAPVVPVTPATPAPMAETPVPMQEPPANTDGIPESHQNLSISTPTVAPAVAPMAVVVPWEEAKADDQLPEPVQPKQDSPTTLDPDDMASRADLMRKPPPKSDALRPVAPAMNLPSLSTKPDKGPSPDAVNFMAWVQAGIADGTLPYNQPGALVHFVRYKDECAMLLVSPLVFRRYAETKETGAEGGLTVQRAFSSAGWHVRGPGGKNVVSYQVMRKGDRGGNLLNGFLVLSPERFFNPVPPSNDRLVFWNADPASPPKSAKA